MIICETHLDTVENSTSGIKDATIGSYHEPTGAVGRCESQQPHEKIYVIIPKLTIIVNYIRFKYVPR